MNWKRTKFSYLPWAILAVITGIACYYASEPFGKSIGMQGNLKWGVFAGVLLVGGLVSALVFWMKKKWFQTIREKQTLFLVLELLFFFCILTFGVLLRIRQLPNFSAGSYYTSAMMKYGVTLPNNSFFGTDDLYVRILHGLCFLLGNTTYFCFRFHLILTVLTGILWYFGIRQLTGRVAALTFAGFYFLDPYVIKASTKLSEEFLFLLFFGIGLLFVSAFLKSYQKSWIPCLLAGIWIGITCFLDLIGLALLLFAISAWHLAEEGRKPGDGKELKEKEPEKIDPEKTDLEMIDLEKSDPEKIDLEEMNPKKVEPENHSSEEKNFGEKFSEEKDFEEKNPEKKDRKWMLSAGCLAFGTVIGFFVAAFIRCLLAGQTIPEAIEYARIYYDWFFMSSSMQDFFTTNFGDFWGSPVSIVLIVFLIFAVAGFFMNSRKEKMSPWCGITLITLLGLVFEASIHRSYYTMAPGGPDLSPYPVEGILLFSFNGSMLLLLCLFAIAGIGMQTVFVPEVLTAEEEKKAERTAKLREKFDIRQIPQKIKKRKEEKKLALQYCIEHPEAVDGMNFIQKFLMERAKKKELARQDIDRVMHALNSLSEDHIVWTDGVKPKQLMQTAPVPKKAEPEKKEEAPLKAEAPKAEAPKTEADKTETDKTKVEKAEAGKIQAVEPKTEKAEAEKTFTEASKAERTVDDKAGAEGSKVEKTEANKAIAEESKTEIAVAGKSGIEKAAEVMAAGGIAGKIADQAVNKTADQADNKDVDQTKAPTGNMAGEKTSDKAEAEKAKQARLEAEKARIEAEKAEQARLEAEQARIEAEKAKQARLEAEKAELVKKEEAAKQEAIKTGDEVAKSESKNPFKAFAMKMEQKAETKKVEPVKDESVKEEVFQAVEGMETAKDLAEKTEAVSSESEQDFSGLSDLEKWFAEQEKTAKEESDATDPYKTQLVKEEDYIYDLTGDIDESVESIKQDFKEKETKLTAQMYEKAKAELVKGLAESKALEVSSADLDREAENAAGKQKAELAPVPVKPLDQKVEGKEAPPEKKENAEEDTIHFDPIKFERTTSKSSGGISAKDEFLKKRPEKKKPVKKKPQKKEPEKVEEKPQTNMLHNPLPLPKKHVTSVMDYDYEVSDDDDYDYD